MVALVVERALHDVGGVALEFGVEVLVHREAPDTLAALAARPLQPVVQLGTVGERTGVAVCQRSHARACQRREIEHEARLGARGQRERVGQHHAALGVAVHDLDRDAVERAHDFLRPVRVGPDLVLGEREPALDRIRRFESRQCEQRADRDRAALHVAVHRVHAAVGLEVDAARVEADAFAHERDAARILPCPRGAGTLRRIRKPHDASAAVRVGPGYGCEGAGTHAFELVDADELERPAFAPRQLPQCGPIGDRIEHVRRQRRQPAREVVARRGRGAAFVDGGGAVIDADAGEGAGRRGFGFLLGHRCRVREKRAQQGLERCGACAGRDELAGVQVHPGDAGLQHFAGQLAGQLQPLEPGGTRFGEADHDQGLAAIGQPADQDGRVLAAALLGLQQFSPQGRLWQRVDGFALRSGFFEQDDGAVGTGQRVVRQRERLRRDVDIQLGRNDFLHGENLDPDRLGPDHSRHAFCVQRAGRNARSGAGRMLTGRAGQSITSARRRRVPPG